MKHPILTAVRTRVAGRRQLERIIRDQYNRICDLEDQLAHHRSTEHDGQTVATVTEQ